MNLLSAIQGSLLCFLQRGKLYLSLKSISPTFLKVDIAGALNLTMLPFILVFLVLEFFNTMGTLVGVGERAGFIKDNSLPQVGKAILSDAVGTVAGAALGTSTATLRISRQCKAVYW